MILADTSVWIDYLDRGRSSFAHVLDSVNVVMHPYVVGEILLGNLRNRAETILLLTHLPEAVVARHNEVMYFIEEHRIFGRGVGYVDAHLLVSSRLTGATLFTRDKRLHMLAVQLGMATLL